MQADFQDFLQWPTHTISLPDDEPHFVHINRLPVADSLRFDVGTIIVKSERPTPAPEDWKVYAMAKRGRGFNARGALGWEWFELLPRKQVWEIAWRGTAPPDGVTYRCVTPTPGREVPDCNSCHAQARDNDFVLNSVLRLHAKGPEGP